jgi:hypothetical protein
MDDKKTDGPPSPTATDAEIASAAKQLGVNARRSTAVTGRSSGGQVLQSLARGRSHMVKVEIKRSRRREHDSVE